MPALDGVRGVAILWVMLFHMEVVPAVGTAATWWQTIAGQGGLGVDIFFVLSGFLITGILLDDRGQPNYFRNFYARRVLRIFPLYYAVVFISLVVLPHATHLKAEKFQHATSDGIWYWLYLSNFAIARRGAFVHGILDVSWSLSIEEQFYLLWPLLVSFVPSRKLRVVCLALVALSCASRLVLTACGVNPVAVYTLTFCRLDGLSIGALAALSVRSLEPDKLRRMLAAISPLSVILVGLTFMPMQWRWVLLANVTFRGTAISLLAACAVIASVVSAPRAVVAVFSVGSLRTLGRFSYAMYLFHYPLMAALRDTVLTPARMPLLFGSSLPSQLVFDLVAILTTLLFSFCSWHAYEKWFLQLKRYF